MLWSNVTSERRTRVRCEAETSLSRGRNEAKAETRQRLRRGRDESRCRDEAERKQAVSCDEQKECASRKLAGRALLYRERVVNSNNNKVPAAYTSDSRARLHKDARVRHITAYLYTYQCIVYTRTYKVLVHVRSTLPVVCTSIQ